MALGFFVFLGVLGYLGVHRKLTQWLDDRARASKRNSMKRAGSRRKPRTARGISAQARRGRERGAEIVTSAKAEAERLAVEAKGKVEEYVARRTKMAETKIAQAEAQAVADVRAAAAEAAVAAAEKILSEETKGKLAAQLIAKGIDDVRKKLN